jgi:NADP-reducing hydrogenase subunit HndD
VCPTGALTERDDTERDWAALADPKKHVVVGTAPSVRADLGECFGMPVGTNVENKMAASLRRLGFDRVFDVDTAADLTIMEEGTELLDRLQNGGALPMITSCSPGWIKFCEHFYPDFLPNLSTCKSPHEMLGAAVKSYYAEKMGIDPDRVNPMGNAIALGHPLGATGAILTLTCAYALRRNRRRYGLVTMCIGGGQGIALVLEAA